MPPSQRYSVAVILSGIRGPPNWTAPHRLSSPAIPASRDRIYKKPKKSHHYKLKQGFIRLLVRVQMTSVYNEFELYLLYLYESRRLTFRLRVSLKNCIESTRPLKRCVLTACLPVKRRIEAPTSLPASPAAATDRWRSPWTTDQIWHRTRVHSEYPVCYRPTCTSYSEELLVGLLALYSQWDDFYDTRNG